MGNSRRGSNGLHDDAFGAQLGSIPRDAGLVEDLSDALGGCEGAILGLGIALVKDRLQGLHQAWQNHAGEQRPCAGGAERT